MKASTTLRDTGLPVVIVTHGGPEIRKTPLMRVKDRDNYILVGSQVAPKDPAWTHNLHADPHIDLRDESTVRLMLAGEVKDAAEKARP